MVELGPGPVLRVGGHLLDLHVTILQAKRNICKFEGRAMLGDALAAECQFTAMIADPPSD